MRAWTHHTDQLEAAGARLLILSGDDRDVLAAKVAERGFGELAIAPASPSDWEALGVQNPKRASLPHPTTLVLGPDGTVWFTETHENFRGRTDPERALAALEAKGAAGEPSTGADDERSGAPATDESDPDWENGARITVLREPGAVRVVLDIGEGFHAYGTKETTGVPVYLRVDDGPRAKGPDGVATEWAGGTSWVLEGRVELAVEVPGSGPVSGSVGWQLCTQSACSAPRNQPFSLDGLATPSPETP